MTRLLRGALLVGTLALGLGASARADDFRPPYGPGYGYVGYGYGGGHGHGHGHGHRRHFCHHHRRWDCACGGGVPAVYAVPAYGVPAYPYPYAPTVQSFSFGFSTGGYPGPIGGYPW